METWAVLGTPTAEDKAADPQQRFRPLLDGAGPDVAFHDDDGQVMSYDAVGLEVTAGGALPGGASGTVLAGSPAPAAQLHLTDRRAVAVAPDTPDAGRHLVAQADFLCLSFVLHRADPNDGARRIVEVGVLTGEPGERAVEVFATSVEAEDVEAVTQGIYARTRMVQSRNGLRPATPEMMHALMIAGPVRTGDVTRVDFALSNLTMAELARLAYPRRYAAG
jgi:hypothetical protein